MCDILDFPRIRARQHKHRLKIMWESETKGGKGLANDDELDDVTG